MPPCPPRCIQHQICQESLCISGTLPMPLGRNAYSGPRVQAHRHTSLDFSENPSPSGRSFRCSSASCSSLTEPHPGSPTVLCDELNSCLFQSLLHRVDGGTRDVAARFFKINNR